MTPVVPRKADDDATHDDANSSHDGDQTPGQDPRATSHPTGHRQAADNAENEPAG